jgi:hypothetical protein
VEHRLHGEWFAFAPISERIEALQHIDLTALPCMRCGGPRALARHARRSLRGRKSLCRSCQGKDSAKRSWGSMTAEAKAQFLAMRRTRSALARRKPDITTCCLCGVDIGAGSCITRKRPDRVCLSCSHKTVDAFDPAVIATSRNNGAKCFPCIDCGVLRWSRGEKIQPRCRSCAMRHAWTDPEYLVRREASRQATLRVRRALQAVPS